MINSKIEWCDDTCNLWMGCTKVHAGCDNCYAETFLNRFKGNIWGDHVPRVATKNWKEKLDAAESLAKKEGRQRSVFVGSLMDICEKSKPTVCNTTGAALATQTSDIRQELFSMIEMGYYDQLNFLFVTKRASNIKNQILTLWAANGVPKNVWFGVSVSDMSNLILIDQLNSAYPGNNKFISMEPQLGPIQLISNQVGEGKVNCIIQGGESGNMRRPFKLEWAYSMQDFCNKNGIDHFFKQIDKVKNVPQDLIESRKKPW